jgi:hypothetical protein
MPPKDLRAAMVNSSGLAGVRRRVTIVGDDGADPWAVEHRAVPEGGSQLGSVVNQTASSRPEMIRRH